MITTIPGPDLAEFEDARDVVAGVIARTPMEPSQHLSELLGVPVLPQAREPAAHRLVQDPRRLPPPLALTAEERARGVVAASAGNHAQGVALAAQRARHPRPRSSCRSASPVPKLSRPAATAPTSCSRATIGETPLRLAAEFAERTGAVLIPPFDHPDIIAGQGTLGLEILEEVPDATTIVVPIGGGGLIAGVAAAVEGSAAAREGRTVRIIGVQAENAAPYPPSLAAGQPLEVPTSCRRSPTASPSQRPGDLPFEIIRELVDEVVTVTEDDIARALLVLLERAKQVVEPAGAVGVAAILAGQGAADGPDRRGALGRQHRPAAAAARRRARARGIRSLHDPAASRCPTARASSRASSELLAEAGANVIEVLHTRHGSGAADQRGRCCSCQRRDARRGAPRARRSTMLRRGGLQPPTRRSAD